MRTAGSVCNGTRMRTNENSRRERRCTRVQLKLQLPSGSSMGRPSQKPTSKARPSRRRLRKGSRYGSRPAAGGQNRPSQGNPERMLGDLVLLQTSGGSRAPIPLDEELQLLERWPLQVQREIEHDLGHGASRDSQRRKRRCQRAAQAPYSSSPSTCRAINLRVISRSSRRNSVNVE